MGFRVASSRLMPVRLWAYLTDPSCNLGQNSCLNPKPQTARRRRHRASSAWEVPCRRPKFCLGRVYGFGVGILSQPYLNLKAQLPKPYLNSQRLITRKDSTRTRNPMCTPNPAHKTQSKPEALHTKLKPCLNSLWVVARLVGL